MGNENLSDSMKWLSHAESDFGVAKHLMNTYYPKPLEIICFHCQQAAEKAVKAVIVLNGCQGGLPKKHDITMLLNQIKNMVSVDEALFDYADMLAPYGVAMRYPNEMILEERHAETAISIAAKFVEWANEIVRAPLGDEPVV